MASTFSGNLFLPEGVEPTQKLLAAVDQLANKTQILRDSAGLLDLRKQYELDDGAIADIFIGQHVSAIVVTYPTVTEESETEEEELVEEEDEYTPSGLFTQNTAAGYETLANGDKFQTWLFGNDGYLYEAWKGRISPDLRTFSSVAESECNRMLELSAATFCQAFGAAGTPLEERELWGGLTIPDGETYQRTDTQWWPIIGTDNETYYVESPFPDAYFSDYNFVIRPKINSPVEDQINITATYTGTFVGDAYDPMAMLLDVSPDGRKCLVKTGFYWGDVDGLGVSQWWDSAICEVTITGAGTNWSATITALRYWDREYPDSDVDDRPPAPYILSYRDIPITNGNRYFIATPKVTLVNTFQPLGDPPECQNLESETIITLEYPPELQATGTNAELYALWPNGINVPGGTTTRFLDTLPPFTIAFVLGNEGGGLGWDRIISAYYNSDGSIEYVYQHGDATYLHDELQIAEITGSIVVRAYQETITEYNSDTDSCDQLSGNTTVTLLSSDLEVRVPAQSVGVNYPGGGVSIESSAGTITYTVDETTQHGSILNSELVASYTASGTPYKNGTEGADAQDGWWTWSAASVAYNARHVNIILDSGQSFPFTLGPGPRSTDVYNASTQNIDNDWYCRTYWFWRWYGFGGGLGEYPSPVQNGTITFNPVEYVGPHPNDYKTTTLTNWNGPPYSTDSQDVGAKIVAFAYSTGIDASPTFVQQGAQFFSHTVCNGRVETTEKITAMTGFPSVTCGGKIVQMIINTSDQTFSGTTTYPWQPTTGETEAKIYHGNILTPTGVIALPSVPPGSNGTEVKKDLPGQLQRNLLSGAIPSDVRMTYEMRMGSSMNPITGQYVLNCLYPVTWVGLYNASNPIPTLPDPRAKVIMYTEAELPDNFGGAVTVDIDGDYVITPP